MYCLCWLRAINTLYIAWGLPAIAQWFFFQYRYIMVHTLDSVWILRSSKSFSDTSLKLLLFFILIWLISVTVIITIDYIQTQDNQTAQLMHVYMCVILWVERERVADCTCMYNVFLIQLWRSELQQGRERVTWRAVFQYWLVKGDPFTIFPTNMIHSHSQCYFSYELQMFKIPELKLLLHSALAPHLHNLHVQLDNGDLREKNKQGYHSRKCKCLTCKPSSWIGSIWPDSGIIFLITHIQNNSIQM